MLDDRRPLVHGDPPGERQQLHLHRQRRERVRPRGVLVPERRRARRDRSQRTGCPDRRRRQRHRDRLLAPAASDGGSPITGYLLSIRSGGTVLGTCPGGATVRSCTFNGATNGTPYDFFVVAQNAVGNSAASAVSNVVVPSVLPGAPTSVTASRGNASAVVSWTAPTSQGGGITGYAVTSNPAGGTSTCTTATSCTVSNLVNGTAYTFTVVAQSASGNGPASAASSPVVPATVPGAPTGVAATVANASSTLTWSAPSTTGGSAVTGYRVTSSPSVGTICSANLTSTATSCAVAA